MEKHYKRGFVWWWDEDGVFHKEVGEKPSLVEPLVLDQPELDFDEVD